MCPGRKVALSWTAPGFKKPDEQRARPVLKPEAPDCVVRTVFEAAKFFSYRILEAAARSPSVPDYRAPGYTFAPHARQRLEAGGE